MTGNTPLYLTKMATVINLHELEAFFLSLKDECCESVLEISMKCVEALKVSKFSEAIAFNQVRIQPTASCTHARAMLVATCRPPGSSV